MVASSFLGMTTSTFMGYLPPFSLIHQAEEFLSRRRYMKEVPTQLGVHRSDSRSVDSSTSHAHVFCRGDHHHTFRLQMVMQEVGDLLGVAFLDPRT
jgi:hypothetical protein